VGTTPDPHWSPASDDFVPTAELIRRKGVGPITSVDVLGAVEDPFGSDREYADFLADLYSSRRSDLA
jgi:heme oxygenase